MMMRTGFRYPLLAVIVLGLASLPACKQEDTTPPFAPWVDEIASPTPEAQPLITGSAEYGATVRITGGEQPVETVADPYTARWKARVSLSLGANSLSVTATDAAGNESEPTPLELEYIEPGTPVRIEISGPETVRAGEPASFTVEAWDIFDNPVENLQFTLTTDAPAGSTTFDASTIISFCSVGEWTVTATTGTGEMAASTTITITPGRAVALDLVTTPSPAVISAGETVDYVATPMDSCGNVTDDYVDVYTNAPGALAANGTITGLIRAGSWVIVAQVPGTSAVDSVDLLIDADETSTVVVINPTSHTAFVGIPIGYTVIAVDGYGNPVDTPPAITVPTDPGATIDPVTHTITFSTPGNHTVTATVGNASDSTFVIVTDPDLSPPEVEILSPVGGTVYGPGDAVQVTVSATDDHGLALIYFQASGADTDFQTQIVPLDPFTQSAPTQHVTVFIYEVTGRQIFGDVTLVAQAVDTTGNYASSLPVTIRIDPARDLVTAGGFSAETVSAGDELNGPRGLTVDPTGLIYVANNGNSSVLEIDPGLPFGPQTIFSPDLGGPHEDIAYYPATGTFFLTVRGAEDRIFQIDANGIPTDFSASMGPGPCGIIVDGGSSITALWRDGIIRRYDPTDAPIANPIFSMNADPPLNGAAWGLTQIGARYAATDEGNDEAWIFDPPGTSGNNVQNSALIADAPPLDRPRDIVLSPNGGFLYVANEGDGRIVRIDVTNPCSTCPTSTIVSGMNGPWGLVFDANGDLLVSDEGDDIIYRISGPF